MNLSFQYVIVLLEITIAFFKTEHWSKSWVKFNSSKKNKKFCHFFIDPKALRYICDMPLNSAYVTTQVACGQENQFGSKGLWHMGNLFHPLNIHNIYFKRKTTTWSLYPILLTGHTTHAVPTPKISLICKYSNNFEFWKKCCSL